MYIYINIYTYIHIYIYVCTQIYRDCEYKSNHIYSWQEILDVVFQNVGTLTFPPFKDRYKNPQHTLPETNIAGHSP